MRKIFIIIISVLFFVNKEKVVMSGITAINIWSNTLFPLLFPTFIINDLLISTDIVNYISLVFGPLYSKLFKTTQKGAYVFIMSMISGTPSNAKNLKDLYINHNIDKKDITKVLCTCYFFNPLFIISFTNLKTLLSLYLANIIASVIMNIHEKVPNSKSQNIQRSFNFSQSIETNINILINILGTITIFLVISSLLPINNIYLKTLISGLLELTTGLNLLSSIEKGTYIAKLILSITLSFGGLSILYQIKSIFKDTSIDIKYFTKNRILCSLILYMLLL